MQRRKPLTRRTGLKTKFAKQLRASSTDAERRLWSLLSERPIMGLQFSRRSRIGPCIVDFCCPAAELIVELEKDGQSVDETQTDWLEAAGYRVLRISTADALRNPQIVLDEIARMFEIRAVPSPRID